MICWTLRAWWQWWMLPAVLAVFMLVGWQGGTAAARFAASEGVSATVWDGIAIALAGPAVDEGGLLQLLSWLVPQMVFFNLVGDVVYGELTRRGETLLPLVGARGRWWTTKVVALAVIALGYTVAALVGTTLGVLFVMPQGGNILLLNTLLPEVVLFTPADLSAQLVLLSVSTLFALALLQASLALWLRDSVYGLGIILFILIGSWLMGNASAQAVRWLPGSQGMLLRHWQLADFTIAWSLAYNALVALAAGLAGAWRVRTMDILG